MCVCTRASTHRHTHLGTMPTRPYFLEKEEVRGIMQMNYVSGVTEKSLDWTEGNLQLERFDCLLLGSLRLKVRNQIRFWNKCYFYMPECVTEKFMPVISSSNPVYPVLGTLHSFPTVLGVKTKLVASRPWWACPCSPLLVLLSRLPFLPDIPEAQVFEGSKTSPVWSLCTSWALCWNDCSIVWKASSF